ncbi:uncharacterized protein LOC113748773 [Coffea eugenioides]|uniref:uncharacterized protein LOC113748773 n=1 Tax=Coffea eugenioides TaxID=49369 RepID=UPI000F5C33A3|nr:uncharacterized protein LOC113713716 [Coffea arabica]XP_027148122.1 uncharacterized protein LOC113748773 [Coffea eugenioides]
MATKLGTSMEEVEINNDIGGENQSRNIKLEVAIRCAKSAMLLSSLKRHHSSHSSTTLTNDDEKVEELKKELVKARVKNKKMRTCSFYELCLQIALLFSLWTLCLLIAFNFLHQFANNSPP